ncbi:hypothetical protein HN011_000967 [Eciton burchellii]|nr:hypothetical protein HN011_000967 [Eciton burchellii]
MQKTHTQLADLCYIQLIHITRNMSVSCTLQDSQPCVFELPLTEKKRGSTVLKMTCLVSFIDWSSSAREAMKSIMRYCCDMCN